MSIKHGYYKDGIASPCVEMEMMFTDAFRTWNVEKPWFSFSPLGITKRDGGPLYSLLFLFWRNCCIPGTRGFLAPWLCSLICWYLYFSKMSIAGFFAIFDWMKKFVRGWGGGMRRRGEYGFFFGDAKQCLAIFFAFGKNCLLRTVRAKHGCCWR